jgi:hypothetical protein
MQQDIKPDEPGFDFLPIKWLSLKADFMTDIQIKNTKTPLISPVPTIEVKSGPTGFAGIFDSSQAKMDSNNNADDSTSLFQNRITPKKTNIIKLGQISSAQPTVSHLSINHPEYGQDCWEIIHSNLNKNKPYTRIPAGTKIYLDPESKEILWDNINHDRTGMRTINPPRGSRRPRAADEAENNIFFKNKLRSHFSKIIEVNPLSAGQGIKTNEQHLIDRSVSRAAAEHELPQELIMGVIKAESDFQVRAVSPAGAQGLMQLMPATARELGVKNPFDIKENIEGGVRYLKKMLHIFKGNLVQALAAYNAGPQAVKNHQGRIPFQETRLYVKRVLSFLNHFK